VSPPGGQKSAPRPPLAARLARRSVPIMVPRPSPGILFRLPITEEEDCMTHRRAVLALAALAVGIGIAAAPARAKVEAGQPVKEFQLRDLWTDKDVKLSQFKGKPVVLIFISDKCDVTWRYERRIGKLMQTYGPKGVQFLAVRSSARDTPQQIKTYAEAKNFTMPLLYDDKNVLADYLGVRVTPTFFVIDGKGVLRYQGACDDDGEEAGATRHYVVDALDAVLGNKEVPVKETAAFG
jgi:peroxiredoxin